MPVTQFALVSGKRGDHSFYGYIQFTFNPLTCARAAPVIEDLFFGKSVEACERIAKQCGFHWKLLPAIDHTGCGSHPGWKK